MSLIGTISGVAAVNAIFDNLGGDVAEAAAVGMRKAVLQGQSIVRAKASGRPGPRVISGDFRRSIQGNSERVGPIVFGQIGSSAAQAARLEFGFVGRDSLGRNYNQPPYPYLLPSVPEVEAFAQAAIASEIQARL